MRGHIGRRVRGLRLACAGGGSMGAIRLRPETIYGNQTKEWGLRMKEAVIVSAVRTPVGKFQGSLGTFAAPKIGALAVREAVRRAGLDARQIDECIMGCVLQAG